MQNKTVILTGISSGLGQALFDELCNKVNLICISRTFLAYQTAFTHDHIKLLSCDLGKTEQVSRLAQNLGKFLKGVDEVVYIDNAATILPIGLVGEIDGDSIIEAANVNFVSPMLITNALCKLKKKVTVIHITAGATRRPIVGWPLYCPSKAAARMFYQILKEQHKGKVTVHLFAPGVMDTPMQKKIWGKEAKKFLRVKIPTLKLADPSEIAKKLVKRYKI